jgi:hypothetical protein
MARLGGLSIAIAAFVVSLALAPWEFPTGADGAAMLATADSLFERHTLAIDARFTTDARYTPSAKRGIDGEAYAKYGIGLPILEVPFLGIARAVHRISGFSQSRARVAVLSLINPLLTALVVLILQLTCERLGASRLAAGFVALGYVLTTPALSYATYDNSEALQAFVVALAVWTLVVFEQDGRDRALWICGVALACGALTKTTLVVLAPAFALAAWFACCSNGSNRIAAVGRTAKLVVPFIVAVGVVGWLNLVRFGSVTATGYNTPVLTNSLGNGLYGLLLSPNKGLVVYAPLVLLAPLGIARLCRRSTATAIVIVLGTATWTVLNAVFFDWGGGWVWGPRYLQPMLPLVFLAVSSAAERPGVRGLMGVLCAAGLLVNLLGVIVDEGAYRRTLVNVWLGDRTGYATVGDATSGEIITVPRSTEDVVAAFSSIAGHWWLARVALVPCDCSGLSLNCACRTGDFATNPVFLSPPWRTQFPQALPSPPYGASIIWPRLLREAYRTVVFDPDRPPIR